MKELLLPLSCLYINEMKFFLVYYLNSNLLISNLGDLFQSQILFVIMIRTPKNTSII